MIKDVRVLETVHSLPAVLSKHCGGRVHWNFVTVRFDWYFTRLNFLFQLNFKNRCSLSCLRRASVRNATSPGEAWWDPRPAVGVYPIFSYPSLHRAPVSGAIHVQDQGCQHRLGGFILLSFICPCEWPRQEHCWVVKCDASPCKGRIPMRTLLHQLRKQG